MLNYYFKNCYSYIYIYIIIIDTEILLLIKNKYYFIIPLEVFLIVTGFVQTKPPQLVGQHLPIPKQCESEKQDWLQIYTGNGGGQEPGFSTNGSYLYSSLWKYINCIEKSL